MKDCTDFSLFLSLKLDHMLPEPDSAALEEHLLHCPDCRALQAELLQLHEDMAALSAPPPPGLSDAVGAKIRAETVATPRSGLFRRYRTFWAGAAVFALLLSALALGPGLSRGDETSISLANDGAFQQTRDIQPFAVEESAPESEESGMEDIADYALEPVGGANQDNTTPGTLVLAGDEDAATKEAPPSGEANSTSRQDTLSPEGEAALELLYAHLEKTKPSWELIVYQDFDEIRGVYRFLVSYPDETPISYEVHLYNSAILRLDHTP